MITGGMALVEIAAPRLESVHVSLDGRDRTKAFALRVIRLYRSLPYKTDAQVMGKQLLRCGSGDQPALGIADVSRYTRRSLADPARNPEFRRRETR